MKTASLEEALALAERAYMLPSSLIRAIVTVESGGTAGSIRAEPQYRYLWDCAAKAPFRALTGSELEAATPPTDFPAPAAAESRATEWWGQRMSWGAMQVMGAVARELGFRRPFGALCHLYTGIAIGCQYFLLLHQRYYRDFGAHGVIAAYNAGSPRHNDNGEWVNQSYVDKIVAAGGLEQWQ